MSLKPILIVEDEIKIAQLLADYLKKSHFDTAQLHHGNDVEPWLNANQSQLILLDLMLPGIDGLELCKRIRKTSNVPIILVTARVEEIDRLLGLELGADDYICKPFSPREVVARVKAVLRRSEQGLLTNLEDNSTISLDVNTFKVSYAGQQCILTKVEFYLFQKLHQHPGQIFSRDKLMNAIYDDQHVVSDRTIDSHIKKLRKKLAAIGIEETAIHSVYGAGYKFE